jgi:hypothetical protein
MQYTLRWEVVKRDGKGYKEVKRGRKGWKG